jgi:cellulose synthase/poly-beta-1,6-N-acetylglucosamine synthase-like glycosyltransferase
MDQAIQRLDYTDLELILLPDGDAEGTLRLIGDGTRFPIRCQATGPVSPAVKRDLGAERASGELLAFTDDDAYPARDWLSAALPLFADDSVCAVGGPQLTPDTDSFWQRVSGATFLSVLNGKAVSRYWPTGAQFETDDWPSVNLIVRKVDFMQVGGFDSQYWPGEDTKLCLDLTRKPGRRILYSPRVIVYHHRRGGLGKHLKQVGNYGLHRGFFAKRLPATSRRLIYVVPSAFFVFASLGWLVLLGGPICSAVYGLLWALYGLTLAVSVVSIYARNRSLLMALATVPYVVATHYWYGLRFLQGLLLVRDMASQLGR